MNFSAAQVRSDPAPAPRVSRGAIARNVLSSWAWQAVGVVSSFILPHLIARRLGDDVLGMWDLGWSLCFYVGWMHLGITASVNRYVARYRTLADWQALNEIANTSLVMLGASFMIGVVLAVAFSLAVPLMVPKAPPHAVAVGRWVIFLLALYSSVQLPSNVFNAVLTGCERFDVLNLIRGTVDMLAAVTNIATLYAGLGLEVVAATLLAGELVSGAVKYLAVRRICPELRLAPRRATRRAGWELLRFGGKTVLQGVFRGSLYQLNALMIAQWLGPQLLAVFSRQRSLVMNVMQFVRQYAQVFIPTSSALDAAADEKAQRRLLVQSSRWGLLVALPPLVLLACMGGPILNLWMGRAYEAPWVLGILAVGHVLSVLQLSSYSVLMGMNRHGRPVVFEIFTSIAGVVLGAVLMFVFNLGILGGAVAIAAPLALFSGVVVPLYACELLKLRFTAFLREVTLVPILAAAPFAAVLLLARLVLPDRPLVALAVGSGTGGAVLAGVYWRFVLPADLRARLAAKLLRRGASPSASRPDSGSAAVE